MSKSKRDIVKEVDQHLKKVLSLISCNVIRSLLGAIILRMRSWPLSWYTEYFLLSTAHREPAVFVYGNVLAKQARLSRVFT